MSYNKTFLIYKMIMFYRMMHNIFISSFYFLYYFVYSTRHLILALSLTLWTHSLELVTRKCCIYFYIKFTYFSIVKITIFWHSQSNFFWRLRNLFNNYHTLKVYANKEGFSFRKSYLKLINPIWLIEYVFIHTVCILILHINVARMISENKNCFIHFRFKEKKSLSITKNSEHDFMFIDVFLLHLQTRNASLFV